jgi:hypothetical protein
MATSANCWAAGRENICIAGVTSLLQAADQAEIARWIEFPNSVLLFLLVPGDPESGALYIMERKTGTWYSVDFDDKQYGGYSLSQLEELLKDCHFLDLVERPGLWRTDFSWWVEAGKRPEARAFDRKICRVIKLHRSVGKANSESS